MLRPASAWFARKLMTENTKVLIAMTTCPDTEVAGRIAEALVNERLAACVNQLPAVSSTYIWNGVVQTDAEVLLMLKTTEARFEALKSRLIELHPYELPELVAIGVCAGAENYLAWVRDSVKSP
jgi:periplasmic divalent cation tolerance protein